MTIQARFQESMIVNKMFMSLMNIACDLGQQAYIVNKLLQSTDFVKVFWSRRLEANQIFIG